MAMLKALQRSGMPDPKSSYYFHPIIETHSKNVAGKTVDLGNAGKTLVDTCCADLLHPFCCLLWLGGGFASSTNTFVGVTAPLHPGKVR